MERSPSDASFMGQRVQSKVSFQNRWIPDFGVDGSVIRQDWQPKSVFELFEAHPRFDFFKPYLPNFNFLFQNITKEPIEKLVAIEVAFFRSAMIAMANRFNADNLIKQEYSFIFEIEDDDQLYTFMTYFSAIVERSPRKLKEVLEDISFTTKPKVMSTLAMLRAEGRAEGRVEGKIEGETLKALTILLKFIANYPEFSAKQIALIVTFEEALIQQLLVTLKTKGLKSTQTFIRKAFLKTIQLEKKEEQEINKLIRQIKVNLALFVKLL